MQNANLVKEYDGLGEAVDTEDSSDSTYKRHTLNCPLLAQLKKMDRPTETDVELIKRYQDGDQSASFLLLIKHYKYLLKIILGITQGHWFSEDILQAGAVGLFEAAKRFDPAKKNTFLTYATSWIKKYVYIEVRNELLPMGGISMGRDAKERLFNFIKLLMQGKTDEEIMKELKIGSKKLNELKIMNVTAARIRSLDTSVSNDSEDDSKVDQYNFVESTDISPIEETLQKQLIEFVEQQVNILAKTEPLTAKILNHRLGLNGEEELSKEEICELLSLKKYEYSKLERAGNKFLRIKLISNHWYDKA